MRALIAVDVQNDFLPGGALGVGKGDEVVQPIVKAAADFDVVVASGDQHPADHMSFAEQGGIWPSHGVRGTRGAEIHPDVLRVADLVVEKGTRQEVDAYSAFDGTGLAETLRAEGVTDVTVTGLATDYCVLATAVDAVGAGFATSVLLDAVRAVNVKPGDGDRAVEKMLAAGVKVVRATHS